MIRKQYILDETHDKYLKTVAKARFTSASAILREIIQEDIERKRGDKR